MLSELVDNLCNKSLVTLPEDVLDLIRDIDSRIDEEGVLKDVAAKSEETTTVLKRARRRYMRAELLHREIGNSLLKLSQSEESETQDSLRSAQRLFATIDAEEFRAERETLMRLLNEKDIEEANLGPGGIKKEVVSFKKTIMPQLEKNFRDNVDTLRGFLDSQESQLPHFSGSMEEEPVLELLKTLQTSLVLFNKEDAELDIKINSQLTQCFVVLWKLSRTLIQILEQTKLGKGREIENVRSAYLLSMCKTSCLKLAVLKYEVLTRTYTSEKVPIFWKFRNDLEVMLERNEKRLRDLKQRLEQYSHTKDGYMDLIQEYGDVLEKIDAKKYCLSELKTVQQ